MKFDASAEKKEMFKLFTFYSDFIDITVIINDVSDVCSWFCGSVGSRRREKFCFRGSMELNLIKFTGRSENFPVSQ